MRPNLSSVQSPRSSYAWSDWCDGRDHKAQVMRLRVSTFPAEGESVGRARRFVRGCLDGCEAGVCEDVVLLVSELVTNAIEHGGRRDHVAEVELEVIVADDHVHIEVSDHSSVVPVPRAGPIDRPSGRGLALVDRLASRWGVARGASGKTVWMEVARERRPADLA